MVQVVNLRTRRKQAAREKARAAGAESAARHGQGLVDQRLAKARAEKAARDLDGHRRETERD